MTEQYATGVSVTFTPIHKDKFLFVQRALDDSVLGGYWCFPGGKVHVGETVSTAIERECLEETGLKPTGRIFFVDSYLLSERLGLHFAIEVTTLDFQLNDELHDAAWLATEADLGNYNPRIPGINNHVHYILNHLHNTATHWQTLDQFDLVKPKFINP
jgi:8-oxo-dGTP pyrophosphatase MutT (NUDIX family)